MFFLQTYLQDIAPARIVAFEHTSLRLSLRSLIPDTIGIAHKCP
jgi:hypothetical protein